MDFGWHLASIPFSWWFWGCCGDIPRSGWKKPASDRRLSDLASVGLLTRVFPVDVVEGVVVASGHTQQCHRALPVRGVAYFSIGVALYADGSYADVFAELAEGLSWASGWCETYPTPSKSAIFRTRRDWGRSRCEISSIELGHRWQRRRCPAGSWRGVVWRRSTGHVWMWSIPLRARNSPAVRHRRGVSRWRFYRSG